VSARESAARWADALDEWAIPRNILERAPTNPWEFPPALFARVAEQAMANASESVSYKRAVEALPAGGSVLDVGVGAGAASLPLCPPAGLLIGVDDMAEMLRAFARNADSIRVANRVLLGRWPAVAPVCDSADVVVCHHVFYNVRELEPFVAALTDHARRRVVVELTATHPTSVFNPLWLALHGIERPTTPTADDALAVIADMGIDAHSERSGTKWTGPGGDRAEVVTYVSRRLCIGPDRAAEVDALLGPDCPELSTACREVVTAWWQGEA
jgi:SAM-dependent methyltransferase